MQIGILGSGNVGRSLAAAFTKAGHTVRIGTRNISNHDLQQWAAGNISGDSIATFDAAAAFGEVLFLCTNWQGTENAIRLAGEGNCKSKVVIDVTNPLDGKGPDASGRLSFVIGHDTSAGEQVQAWLPGSRVVKALNMIGAPLMDHPRFEEGAPTMFIAGNDTAARHTTEQLLRQIGWDDVVDIGDIAMCRNIEPLCNLWCAYGFRTGTWHHALKLLRK